MPATPLTVATITRAGIAPTLAAANADGHTIPSNNARTFLHIKNASGAPVTVSAVIATAVDGVTPAPKSVSVPAGAERLFGPFPREVYNDSAGAVAISLSAATDVTIGAFAV